MTALLMVSAACGGGRGGPAAPTPPVVTVAGTWDATFNGRIVQRNDGGAVGASQTDQVVLVLTQTGTSVSGTVVWSEGRPGEIRLPLTGALAGSRFQYRVESNLGGCAATIVGDATVNAAGSGFSGTQTVTTCEGRAEGAVTATRR